MPLSPGSSSKDSVPVLGHKTDCGQVLGAIFAAIGFVFFYVAIVTKNLQILRTYVFVIAVPVVHTKTASVRFAASVARQIADCLEPVRHAANKVVFCGFRKSVPDAGTSAATKSAQAPVPHIAALNRDSARNAWLALDALARAIFGAVSSIGSFASEYRAAGFAYPLHKRRRVPSAFSTAKPPFYTFPVVLQGKGFSTMFAANHMPLYGGFDAIARR